MYIINLGDSSAILKSNEYKFPIRLSRQHSTNNLFEIARIEKRNISAEMFDECHSVTRMIGYSKYSNIISTKPEIFIRRIDYEKDQYIVISDRDVWSVLSMDDVDKIYNEVIGQMKDETLVSSNWPDVVAKRILYLVKNKYKVKDEISIIVLILYKKDMPKCKKKIEDISNITPVLTKDKTISFQNIIGMIGLGKTDKSFDLNNQNSVDKSNLNKINDNTEQFLKSDFEISSSNKDKRMSLNLDYNSHKIFAKRSSNIILGKNDISDSENHYHHNNNINNDKNNIDNDNDNNNNNNNNDNNNNNNNNKKTFIYIYIYYYNY